MAGSPSFNCPELPFARAAVGLHNWRERPYSAWAFQHVSELVPSAVIAAPRNPGSAPEAPAANAVLDAEVRGSPGQQAESLERFLTRSQTDRFMVTRGGRLLVDWRAAHARAEHPHIVFSISKSVTAVLAGILQAEGVLDVKRKVSHYLRQAAAGGYSDCSVQNLLDMRADVAFSEDYLDLSGDYGRYRRATLWNPPDPAHDSESLRAFLFSIKKGSGEHGGAFRYLSPNSDLAALLLEQVSGLCYADLMSRLLWQPMGANHDAMITVDSEGSPRGAGGISMSAPDLLQLGQMLLSDGAIGRTQIVPARWLHDMRHNGDGAAWAGGASAAFLPNGRYRNYWYQMAAPSRAFFAAGIHGQWLYVDTVRDVVIVKLSSQSLPQDDALDQNSLAVFSHLSQLAEEGLQGQSGALPDGAQP